jgi:hypothetical protein
MVGTFKRIVVVLRLFRATFFNQKKSKKSAADLV